MAYIGRSGGGTKAAAQQRHANFDFKDATNTRSKAMTWKKNRRAVVCTCPHSTCS
jgi:hypothetical protein